MGARSDTFPHALDFPVSYKPDSSMVPVSLTRGGLPRWILQRHRNMMRVGHPEEGKWVRIYLTLFGLYKLIIVPQPISVSSILDERVFRPFSPFTGPFCSPVVWLHCANRKIVQIPLELGLSSKLLWTAGPMSPPRVGVPAVPHLDAQALLNWLTPMELRFSDVLFVPSVNYLPSTHM